MQGKHKSFPGQTETQVVSFSPRTLSHAAIFPLLCATLVISLVQAHFSSIPFPSWSPLLASVSLWKSAADRGAHHNLLTSTRGQSMPRFLLRCPQLSGTWAPGCSCCPCRLSSKPCCDVRNVTAMLLKGLASCPINGLKKKEEKKIVCTSIMERHQDRAINNR